MNMPRLALAMTGAAIATLGVAASVHAQAPFPTKPIRLIVPAVPGGNAGVLARILGPRMAETLGQAVVIEHRGGAGNIIGTEVVARSAPDGYTILLNAGTHTINPAMVKKLPYDSLKDFASITLLADLPAALVVHPSLPVRSVRELIVLAKQRPGQINYATAGYGTVGHLSVELLSTATGTKFVQVPYKGAGPAMVDVIAGHVEMQFVSMPAAIHHVRSGRLRMIAQGGAQRSPAAPDVPTMVEAGVPGFVVSSAFGLLAPAGTPRPNIDRLHAAALAALAHPEVKKTLLDLGADPVGNTPEEYDAFNRSEMARWIKVARAAGIDPQ